MNLFYEEKKIYFFKMKIEDLLEIEMVSFRKVKRAICSFRNLDFETIKT
jgi:hypothetical protein